MAYRISLQAYFYIYPVLVKLWSKKLFLTTKKPPEGGWWWAGLWCGI
jgi:hypothetical protein